MHHCIYCDLDILLIRMLSMNGLLRGVWIIEVLLYVSMYVSSITSNGISNAKRHSLKPQKLLLTFVYAVIIRFIGKCNTLCNSLC